MFVTYVFGRIKAVLLSFAVLFKRALCCFSRKRRNSYSECEVLQSVNVVDSKTYATQRNETERDWNSWDDSPRTVNEHIEKYRQKLAEPPPSTSKEPAIDFFQDMTPQIIKQKKVLLATESNSAPENFSRLQANQIRIAPVGADLEDWSDDEDSAPAGWEELDDEKTKELIRENRKALRAEKQKHKQHVKQQTFVAERIGSRH